MLFAHVTSSEAFYSSVMPIPVTAFSTMGKAATISEARIVASIYVTAETITAVIPGAAADEHPIRKPFRPIVAIRCALIRRVIVVAIRAGRFSAYLNAETHLRVRLRRNGQKAKSNSSCTHETLKSVHDFLLSYVLVMIEISPLQAALHEMVREREWMSKRGCLLPASLSA
jgi:hypothetical protein